MPYTLGERIYGVSFNGHSNAFSQRLRDIYTPFYGAEPVYFEPDPVTEDESFAPLAADPLPSKSQLAELGKGTLLLLGIGTVLLMGWAVSKIRQAPEETVIAPVPKPNYY